MRGSGRETAQARKEPTEPAASLVETCPGMGVADQAEPSEPAATGFCKIHSPQPSA